MSSSPTEEEAMAPAAIRTSDNGRMGILIPPTEVEGASLVGKDDSNVDLDDKDRQNDGNGEANAIIIEAGTAGDPNRNIELIATAITEDYHLDDSFESPSAVKDSIAVLATSYGFVVRKQGMSIVCNRAYRLQKGKQNKTDTGSTGTATLRNTPSLECGCSFKISFSYSELTTAYERAETKSKKNRHSDKVHITGIHAKHDNGCFPSVQQAKHCLRASGALIDKTSASALIAVNLVRSTHVSAKVLRNLLQDAVPHNFVLTPQDIVNFRLWAMENGDRIQNEHGATFPLNQQIMVRILAGDCVEYKDLTLSQPALFDAAAILRQVLADQLASEQGPHLLNYLELLKTKDSGFDYRVAWSTDDKVVGVVWQTSSMRANFSRYGECLFMDFLKRKLNDINWPYIGPCVLDGYKTVRVVAEGIFASEREDAYTFVLRSLFEMSVNTRSKDNVHAVFADGFFSDDILNKAGIGDTCKYFWDQYHLWNSDWPQFFGGAFAGQLLESLRNMIYARSEIDFEAAFQESKRLVGSNPRFLDYVIDLGANRDRYASYAVEAAKGTLFRHGSSHAEQNNSSVVKHLGDHLYEDPAKEVELLLKREGRQDQLASTHVSRHSLHAVGESRVLADKGAPIELQQAKTALTDWAYELFHSSWTLHLSYEVEVDVNDNSVHRVWHPRNPNKVRTLSQNAGCNCSMRNSLLAMCGHEIAVRHVQGVPRFSADCFAKRWHQLDNTEYIPRGGLDATTSSRTDNRGDLDRQAITNSNLDDNTGNNDDDTNNNDDGNDIDSNIEPDQAMPTSYSYKQMVRIACELAAAAVASKDDVETMGYLQNGLQAIYAKSDQNSNGTSTLQKEETLRQFAHRFNRSMSFKRQDRSISQRWMDQLGSSMPLSQNQHSIPKSSWQGAPPMQLPRQPVALLSGPQLRHSSKKRLRSAYEQSQTGFSQGSTGVRQCGFCGESGHTKPKCSAKQAIGDVLDETAVRALANFIVTQCVLLDQPDRQLVPSSAATLVDLPDSKSVRSICYHGMFYQSQNLPNKEPYYCKLSLYDERGLKPHHYVDEHYFINVRAVSEWMIRTLKNPKIFVFTQRLEE